MLTYEQATERALSRARMNYRMGRQEFGSDPEDCAREALEDVERYLKAVGQDWTFGVKSLSCDGTERSLLYLNAGDTYTNTICWENGRFFESSWGDWYEQAEQKHCSETGTVRCGWCSHLTPIEHDDWRTTICESCNHNVSGS